MYVTEKEFKKFAKENGLCVKLVRRESGAVAGDLRHELHSGGINIFITRILSKRMASVDFFENGLFCELNLDSPREEVKKLCKEFSGKTGIGVIVSPYFLYNKYDPKFRNFFKKELEKGYQEIDLSSFLKTINKAFSNALFYLHNL